jgi:hypothetical protein
MNASLEYELIGNIVKGQAGISEIMERNFGRNCLNKPGFRIQTLEMACILFGVDQRQFLQEIEGQIEQMKLGDPDPQGKKGHCDTISDKARAISGGVLQAIMEHFNG